MKLAKIRIDGMDQHYYGKEPEWVDAESLSDEELSEKISQALSWYGKIAKHRYNKKFLLEFCKIKKYSDKDIELFNRLSHTDISTSVSWLARMQLKGYSLNAIIVGLLRLLLLLNSINSISAFVLLFFFFPC